MPLSTLPTIPCWAVAEVTYFIWVKVVWPILTPVDGAIHRAAGPHLREENRDHGGCGDGEAVISGGYRLPAQREWCQERPGFTCLISDIISTVGPRGEHPDTLRSAYTNCLNKMKEAGLKSIVSLSHRSLSIFRLSDTDHNDTITLTSYILMIRPFPVSPRVYTDIPMMLRATWLSDRSENFWRTTMR